jgi:hypothetical protein
MLVDTGSADTWLYPSLQTQHLFSDAIVYVCEISHQPCVERIVHTFPRLAQPAHQDLLRQGIGHWACRPNDSWAWRLYCS